MEPFINMPDLADHMLYRLARFFNQYLSCAPEQAAVLSVWTAHTWCFSAARTTPYLNICSHQKQSGKTLCLELLNLICANSWYATGISPAALIGKITKSRPTALLDECQTIFGSSDKQIRGLLVSGSKSSGIFEGPSAVSVFCPKAFAGMRIMPLAIDDRSIPILLHPVGPAAPIQRFIPERAAEEGESLVAALRQWVDQNQTALREMPPYTREQFPPELSPREQDLVEPLLQIADRIGGQVPQQIRYCLVKILQHDSSKSCFACLLSDIRDVFGSYSRDRLPSAALLEWLNSLKDRPWRIWHEGAPMNPRDLADVLRPHGITSRNIYLDKNNVPKGYAARDFSPLWQHYLEPKNAAVQP